MLFSSCLVGISYLDAQGMHSSLVYEVEEVVPVKLMVSPLDYLLQMNYLILMINLYDVEIRRQNAVANGYHIRSR